MIILFLIVGVTNFIMCGMLSSMILTKKADDMTVKKTDYFLVLACFISGLYMIISAIGAGAI